MDLEDLIVLEVSTNLKVLVIFEVLEVRLKGFVGFRVKVLVLWSHLVINFQLAMTYTAIYIIWQYCESALSGYACCM